MSNFSTGKKAKAISDRSGMAFPYQEMVKEWNGSFVHRYEFEAKHPQIERKEHKVDAQALRDARPDRTEPAVEVLLFFNPFQSGSSGSAVITVSEPGHGRSTGDTVRFRSVFPFDGFTSGVIENSSGYEITKVDSDSYTFSASSGTATTGQLKGGGSVASAGPVTVSA